MQVNADSSALRCITLQESIEAGARSQLRCDSGGVLDIMLVGVPGKAIFWEDLAGEPLDPNEVVKAMRVELEYFRDMGVYKMSDGWTSRQRMAHTHTHTAPAW